jgi:hypothetical protein
VKRTLALLAIGASVITVPVSGHHSFSAYYFADESISIEGKVQEFDYVNPHVWIHILASDKQGHLQKVSAEWGAPSRLQEQGIVRDTLKPGQRVIVTGSPSRDSANKIQLKRIYRIDDGWSWNGRGERR